MTLLQVSIIFVSIEKLYNNQDPWYSSETGKMVLTFFNIFGTKDILEQNGLFSRLQDEMLECKALCIENYILNSITLQHDPASESILNDTGYVFSTLLRSKSVL